MGMTGGPTPEPLPDLLSDQDKGRLRTELTDIGLVRR
jgi:hypothetical protein